MYVELLTHKILKGRKNCNICFNDIQYNHVSELLKEAQERNIKLTCVEGKHRKCLGDIQETMNKNKEIGAMMCTFCEDMELCREISGGNKNV